MEHLHICVVNNLGQFNHLIHRTLRDIEEFDHRGKAYEVSVELVNNTLTPSEVMELEPSGIVLGGGPSLDNIGRCADYIRDLSLPMLGICLGHQVMALALGGEVKRGKVGGYASIEVEVLEEDGILRGLGPNLRVWASHQDEVTKLPEGFRCLARSKVCNIEAMAHTNLPLYGVQWHPEVAHSEMGEELFMNFLRACVP